MKPCYGLNTLARSGGMFGGFATCGSYYLAVGLQVVVAGLYSVGGVCVRSVQSVPSVCSVSSAPAVALVGCSS